MKGWLASVVIREMQIKTTTHPQGWLQSRRRSWGGWEDVRPPVHRWWGVRWISHCGKRSSAFALGNPMQPAHRGHYWVLNHGSESATRFVSRGIAYIFFSSTVACLLHGKLPVCLGWCVSGRKVVSMASLFSSSPVMVILHMKMSVPFRTDLI